MPRKNSSSTIAGVTTSSRASFHAGASAGRSISANSRRASSGTGRKRDVARNSIWPTTNADGAPRSTATQAVIGGSRSDNVSRTDSR